MSVGDPPAKPEPTFLRRWSQRKLAAARAEEAERPADSASAAPAPAPAAPAATAAAASEAGPEARPAERETPALPDVESLTFDSDFRAFLSPRVDEAMKRAALRKLFADPRFNVMDGLDVYIDDYTKFEPIVPEMLKQLRHARYLFDPPKTRVNEAGHVEDLSDEATTTAAADEHAEEVGTATSTAPDAAQAGAGAEGARPPDADRSSAPPEARPPAHPNGDAGELLPPAPSKARTPG